MKRRSGAADLAYPVTTLLDQPGCAFCRRSEQQDAQAVMAFLTEGKYEPDVRSRVAQAGGFCSRHTRLLHELARRDDLTASLAEVYEMVIRALDKDLSEPIRGGRGRKRAGLLPRDAGPCLLCGQLGESEQRMAGFLAAHLGESAAGRERYAVSAGFCLPHLRLLGERCDAETLQFLRADAAGRLRAVSARLEHYRLLRDYRHRDDPRGDEQWADTDATALLARQRFPETRQR
jgi:hypothetical protein